MATSNAAGNSPTAENAFQLHVIRSLCDVAERARDAVAAARERENTVGRLGGEYEGRQFLHLELVKLGLAHELGRTMRELDLSRVSTDDYPAQHLVRELCLARDRATIHYEEPRFPIGGFDKPHEIDTLYEHSVDHTASEFLVIASDRLVSEHRKCFLTPEAAGGIAIARLEHVLRIVTEIRDGTSSTLPHLDPKFRPLENQGREYLESPASGPGWEKVGEMLSRLRAFDRADMDSLAPEPVRRVVADVRSVVNEALPAPADSVVAERVVSHPASAVPPEVHPIAKRFVVAARAARLEAHRRKLENGLAKSILADLELPIENRGSAGTRLVNHLFDVLTRADLRKIADELVRAQASPPEASALATTYEKRSASEWAEHFGLPKDAYRKRLDRWRSGHVGDENSEWFEVADKKGQRPTYLYSSRAAKEIADEMRRKTP